MGKLFQESSERALKSLQNRSKSIVDVFTKTVDDLNVVNTDIRMLATEKEIEKAKIEEQLVTLAEQEAQNTNVINKINQIFKP